MDTIRSKNPEETIQDLNRLMDQSGEATVRYHGKKYERVAPDDISTVGMGDNVPKA